MAMSGYIKSAVLACVILSMVGSTGCGVCGLCKKRTAEPPQVVEEPPAPRYVEPPPAPAPAPYVAPAPAPYVAPAPAPLPPAVTKSIEELSDRYPDLFKFDKKRGLLYFAADAMFDSGSTVVKSDAKAALGKLANILSEDEVKDRRLTIIGHTDTDRVIKPATVRNLKKLGKTVDNTGLSEGRAEAVASVLESGGVVASRIVTEGRGATEPVADNHTPAGKARNRRVEVYVTPAKSR
jgi:OmpA-OmpF porin, OOP family